MRSPKEISLSAKIVEAIENLKLPGKALEGARLILADAEIQATQEYANTVSIIRLGYNDHGPVHMHCVTLNAIIMLGLLRQAGVKTSLEKEEAGDFDDSLLAVIFASMLHDFGMSISRQDHEMHSAYLAMPVIDRILTGLFPDNLKRKVVIRSLALEGISGHMGNRTIHSLEAGVVQIADGCDMTKGRARISIALNQNAKPGSIHQYSANSIEEVRFSQGQEKPIRIEVLMSSEVGLFQIEEVLLNKIAASTAKPYIELYAQVQGGEPKRYL
jgi:metal-dependent HD superfamily phosphatase/phosphodiesterase